MGKHTPGPWEWLSIEDAEERFGWEGLDSLGVRGVFWFDDVGAVIHAEGVEKGDMQADMQLAAAAPELLAALEAAPALNWTYSSTKEHMIRQLRVYDDWFFGPRETALNVGNVGQMSGEGLSPHGETGHLSKTTGGAMTNKELVAWLQQLAEVYYVECRDGIGNAEKWSARDSLVGFINWLSENGTEPPLWAIGDVPDDAAVWQFSEYDWPEYVSIRIGPGLKTHYLPLPSLPKGE